MPTLKSQKHGPRTRLARGNIVRVKMVAQSQEGIRDEGSEALRARSQMACLSREGQHHPQSPVDRDRACPQEDSPSPPAVGLAASAVNLWAHHWGEGLDPPSDGRMSSSPGWNLLSHFDRGSRDLGTHPDPRSQIHRWLSCGHLFPSVSGRTRALPFAGYRKL